MSRLRMNSPMSSSVGRLFDAVAAILGIRDVVNYEGQAAVELEQHAAVDEQSAYPVTIERGPRLILHGAELVRLVAEEFHVNRQSPIVAARFHNTLVRAIVEVCGMIRTSHGISAVALSGGVFQNQLLLSRAVGQLSNRGFRVLTHRRVPMNDGGVSLGQVAIAAARDRAN